ncbi:MAG: radical domain/B12 binding protein [Rhodospirillales bacterium]|nr:radical domain/B12 binding protein [Rhodospirillales bacterium]
MRVLAVHPSALMYGQVFLRLEPLGLELVAASVLKAGHEARIIDLQVQTQRDFRLLLKPWAPDVVAFSCNYLANVPEVVDLAKQTRQSLPKAVIVVGGHSASFVSEAILAHAEGAIDCVLKGEGEAVIPLLLRELERNPTAPALNRLPGAVSLAGSGPDPIFVENLNSLQPARHLLRHRRKYFLGPLDPCASIEFSRGCPWDCAFCSAWTFYGRSYRLISPQSILEDLSSIREPGVFIVDDVAFVHAEHGMAIGEAIASRGIAKRYYLETRGDVLLRNKEVFKFWKRLGLEFMFLGLEAIDAEGLEKFRKRVSLGSNFEALEFARSLGINVAINIIADPDWDHDRFEAVRAWCLEVPEVVNISVNTPYPGTETWVTEERRLTTRDYRLFDIQHCVLPTRLPLQEYYQELVRTQQVLNMKHLGWRTLRATMGMIAGQALRGQTNFVKSLFRFDATYNPDRMLADHAQPTQYHIPEPPVSREIRDRRALYILHQSEGQRRARA